MIYWIHLTVTNYTGIYTRFGFHYRIITRIYIYEIGILGYILWVKTSRQQVYEYIGSHQNVTAAELSWALEMTPANARHHLKILQDLNLVIVTTHKKQIGKGRPARVYRVSKKDNTDLLAEVLFEVLVENTLPEHFNDLLQTLAKRLAACEVDQSDIKPMSLASRLFLAIQRLNRLDYQARWEARSNAPRLIFANCPYSGIVEKVPQLCSLDAALIQELVGLPAYLKDRFIQDSRGGKICVFQLGALRSGTW